MLKAISATVEAAAARGEKISVPGLFGLSIAKAAAKIPGSRHQVVKKPRRPSVVTQGPIVGATSVDELIEGEQSEAVHVLASHGISVTDGELSAIFGAVLSGMPGGAPDTSLPDDEAMLYDSVGFTARDGAYASQAASAAARYAALVTLSDPVETVADNLGVTRPRVQQMIAAHDLWALRDVRNRWVLPGLQFDRNRVVPGWPVVARAIPAHAHPLEVLGLLETPQPELEVDGEPSRIRDWLLSGGDPAPAAEIAASLAEIGI